MHVGTEVDIKDVNWTIYPHISWIDSDESAAGPVTLTQEWRWGREHLHDWFTPVDEKPKKIERIKHFLQSDVYIVDKLNEIIAFLNKE